MSDLLQLVVSEGASDLHIRVGTPPTIRVHGILHRVEGPTLAPEDTEELMRSITSEEHIQHVRERGGSDFGFAFGEMARFRVSVFKEKGNFGMVLRQIPNKLLELDKIGLPPSVRELLYKPRGLCLLRLRDQAVQRVRFASPTGVKNMEKGLDNRGTREGRLTALFSPRSREPSPSRASTPARPPCRPPAARRMTAVGPCGPA